MDETAKLVVLVGHLPPRRDDRSRFGVEALEQFSRSAVELCQIENVTTDTSGTTASNANTTVSSPRSLTRIRPTSPGAAVTDEPCATRTQDDATAHGLRRSCSSSVADDQRPLTGPDEPLRSGRKPRPGIGAHERSGRQEEGGARRPSVGTAPASIAAAQSSLAS